MTTFTLFDKETCTRNIARIRKAGAKIQELIHQTAVSTLAHVRDHGDYTLALSLMEALPNGQRVKALAYWFRHFSNEAMILNLGSEGWTCKLAKKRTAEQFDIEAAMQTTFADLTAEKDPSTMGVKEVVAFLKRKANDDAKFRGTEKPRVSSQARELLAYLYVQAQEKAKELAA